MNRIQKMKAYFSKYDFYAWKDLDLTDSDLKSDLPDDVFLLDVGIFIKNTLTSANEIGNKRHRLKEEHAIACASLDELIPFLTDILKQDYTQTAIDSVDNNWDFQYFVRKHRKCENTICLYILLKEIGKMHANCIYPIVSVRKYLDTYYCWNHLE